MCGRLCLAKMSTKRHSMCSSYSVAMNSSHQVVALCPLPWNVDGPSVTALTSRVWRKWQSVRLPRLGHKNGICFGPGLPGHLLLEPSCPAVRTFTPYGETGVGGFQLTVPDELPGDSQHQPSTTRHKPEETFRRLQPQPHSDRSPVRQPAKLSPVNPQNHER